jgi:hypothetical protein
MYENHPKRERNMTFLTKLKMSAKSVAGASLCSFIVATVCGQDDLADAAASVFWTSLVTVLGAWTAEEIQNAITAEELPAFTD